MKATAAALALILLALANFPQTALADSFVINAISGTPNLLQTGTNDSVSFTSPSPPGAIRWDIFTASIAPAPIAIFDNIFAADGTTLVGQIAITGTGTTQYVVIFQSCNPQQTSNPCNLIQPNGSLVESGTPPETPLINVNLTNPTSTDTWVVESAPLSTVPEPPTAVVLGTGLIGLTAMTWRKKRLA